MKINLRFAVIGHPTSHSLSPIMHNAAFKSLKLNYSYDAIDVRDLNTEISNLKNSQINGFSVTIPHKIEIIKYLDQIDPLAKKIGAVNTIINKYGKLYGYNTDAIAALKVLKEKTDLRDKKVLIIGSGGVSRAIATILVLKSEVKELVILNKTLKNSQKLIDDLNRLDQKKKKTISTKKLTRKNIKQELVDTNILINATPIGMNPKIKKSSVPKKFLKKELIVFDTIYNPKQTKLIKEANLIGAKTITGVEMFVLQGAKQFELFTGKKAPIKLMNKVVIKELSKS